MTQPSSDNLGPRASILAIIKANRQGGESQEALARDLTTLFRALQSPLQSRLERVTDLPRLIELQRTAAPDCAGDVGWNAGLDCAAEMLREALSTQDEAGRRGSR